MKRARLLFSLIAFTTLAIAPSSMSAQADEDDEATMLLKEGLPLTPERTLSETFVEGSWISLDVSSDGQNIVFDLLGDLYTMPFSGAILIMKWI